MKHTFTPGPWAVEHSPTQCSYITVPERGGYIATLAPCDERKANARLIAAAPELLEALEQLDAWFASGPLVDGQPPVIAHGWIKSAIAKATGEIK